MAQTEGDKEIVLGNKQLISLFFVVVALLGVFFAAGYMIGRKSVGPAIEASPASTTTGAATRQDAEPTRDTAVAPEPVVTAPPPATREQSASKETGQDEEKSSRRPNETAITKPEAGAAYLQVTAMHRADAENLVRSLREQNFPATLAESSKEGLLRVLVGPYHETAKVAEAKSRLKALGFANAFVQR